MIRLGSILIALVLSGCASAGTPPSPLQAEVVPPTPVKVDGPTAMRLVAEGARLVDVRIPEFFAQEHLAGAINIPAAAIADRAAAELGPTDTPVVLYCRTGANSAKAAQRLVAIGYTRVYDLGSYSNWREDGAAAPSR